MSNQFSEEQVLWAALREHLHLFIAKTFNTLEHGTLFLDNWHVHAMAYQLERVFRGEIHRLIITIPPRYLKSISASVAFVAWVLGHDPTKKIICASYAQELAIKHSFDTRVVMEADWYQQCFPTTRLHPDKNTQTEFMTTRSGFRYSTSVGGTLTGRGGNLLIIDDPHKADDAYSDSKREGAINWFLNTAFSRLDNKVDDAIILIQQRFHENDLAGHLIEAGGWSHLSLPGIAEDDEVVPTGPGKIHQRLRGEALHPERESLDLLETARAAMGPLPFAAQYQQRPTPIGGGIIKSRWFKTYAQKLHKRKGTVIQSWDTACKGGPQNDYTVCTTWLGLDSKYYLVDVFRKRLDFPAVRQAVIEQGNKFPVDWVLIEGVGVGLALSQDIRRLTSFNVVTVPVRDDKVTRAVAVSPLIETGEIFLPKEAPWLHDFTHEVDQFPNGKFDDQVDSMTQFLLWARHQYFTPPTLHVNVHTFGREPSLSIEDLSTKPFW